MRNEQRKQRERSDLAVERQRSALKRIARLKPALEELEVKKRLVYIETEWMDTPVVHGSGMPQRLPTTKVYTILHVLYFRVIVEITALRAEVCAVERRLMALNESVQASRELEDFKANAMATLWRKHARKQRMKLRRSALGGLLFGRYQRNILQAVFAGWVKFWTWRLSVRSNYDLRYALELQERQQHAALQQRRDAQDRANRGYAGVDASRSLLRRHQQRNIVCRMCGEAYAESINHERACCYHPGKYEVACPRDCPGFTTSCMSHRAKRWTCCDLREEGRHGTNGCCARFHLPPAREAKYDVVVAEIEARDKLEDEYLREEMDDVQRADWENRARRAKFEQLTETMDELKDERAIVGRFKNLPSAVADGHGKHGTGPTSSVHSEAEA